MLTVFGIFLFYCILFCLFHGGGVYVVLVKDAIFASMWIKMLIRTYGHFVPLLGSEQNVL
jgi:hypothetical protein